MVHGCQLNPATEDEMCAAQHIPYRELVGSLMYLSCTIRPDIMYATGYMARFVSRYGHRHWIALKKIEKYLSSTRTNGLCYGGKDNTILGHTDASWADDVNTRKSTGGFVWTYNATAFAWSSKRQIVVAASRVEAEYIAQPKCVRQGLWVRKLMFDFKIMPRTLEIYADNRGAIAMSKDWKVNEASTHIATAYHLQRDYVAKKMFSMSSVSSDEMVADGMTKPLGSRKLQASSQMYRIIDMKPYGK